MNRILIAALLGVLVGIGTYKAGQRVEKERSFTTARYAAEWGCLVGAQRACTEFSSEGGAAPCREDAMTECTKRAEGFEKFLRQ